MPHVRNLLAACAAIGLAAGWSATSLAGEVRIGVAKHDLTNTETGVDVQGQLVFGQPVSAERRWSLRPYLIASGNSEGNISFGGGGVGVERALAGPWYAEFQAGVIAHDGRIDLPPPDQPVERLRVLETERTYGCETLFHLAPALGRQMGENWRLAVYWEHLSHGKIICDNGKNEGLDNIGVRVARQF